MLKKSPLDGKVTVEYVVLSCKLLMDVHFKNLYFYFFLWGYLWPVFCADELMQTSHTNIIAQVIPLQRKCHDHLITQRAEKLFAALTVPSKHLCSSHILVEQ